MATQRPDFVEKAEGRYHRALDANYSRLEPAGTGYTSWWDAAWREGNLLVAGVSYGSHLHTMSTFKQDLGFQKLFNANQEAYLGGYAKYTDEYPSLLKPKSQAQLDYLKQKVAKDSRERAKLASSGFAESFLPYLAIGVLSPENLIPMAGAARLGFLGKASLGFKGLEKFSKGFRARVQKQLDEIMTPEFVRKANAAFPDISQEALEKLAIRTAIDESPLLHKIGATAIEGIVAAGIAEPLYRLDQQQRTMGESAAIVLGSGVFGAGFGALFGGIGSAYGKVLSEKLGYESMTDFRLDVYEQVGAEWREADEAAEAAGIPSMMDALAEDVGAQRREIIEARRREDGDEPDVAEAERLEQSDLDRLDNPVEDEVAAKRAEILNGIMARRDPDSPIARLIGLGNDNTWFGKFLARTMMWSPNLRSAWVITKTEDDLYRLLGANALTRQKGAADELGDLTKPSLDTAETLANMEGLRRIVELGEIFDENQANFGDLTEGEFRALVAKRARRNELVEDEVSAVDNEFLPQELEGDNRVYTGLETKTPEQRAAIVDSVNKAVDEVYVPYIDEVSKIFRAVGLLDDALTDSAIRRHAANYVTRKYDKNLVLANRSRFKSALLQGLMSMRAAEEPSLRDRLQFLDDTVHEYREFLSDPAATPEDLQNTRTAIEQLEEQRELTQAEINAYMALDNAQDRDALLDQVVRNITGDRVLYHSERTNIVENALMKRVLDVEDKYIEPYLINDIGTAMNDSVRKFFPRVVAFRYLASADQLKSLRAVNESYEKYDQWMQANKEKLENVTLTEQEAREFFELANELLKELNFLNMHNGLTTLSTTRSSAGAVPVVNRVGEFDLAGASQKVREMLDREIELSDELASIAEEIRDLRDFLNGPQGPALAGDPLRVPPSVARPQEPTPYMNPTLVDDIAYRVLLDRKNVIDERLAEDPDFQASTVEASRLARDYQENFEQGTFNATDIEELDNRIVADAPNKVREALEESLNDRKQVDRSNQNEEGTALQNRLQNMSNAQYLAFVVDKVLHTRVRFDRSTGQNIFPVELTDIATPRLLNAILDNSEGGYLYRENQPGVPRGQILFSPDSDQLIIQGFNRADASTALHEQMHGVRRSVFTQRYVDQGIGDITQRELDIAATWSAREAGVALEKDANGEYIWTVDMEEAFAKGFETYVMEGKAPTQGLAKAFEVLANLLSTIYQRLQHAGLLPNLTDEMRSVYDKVLQRSEYLENNNTPTPRMSDDQKQDVVTAFNLVGAEEVDAVHIVLDSMGLDQELLTYQSPTLADYIAEQRALRRRVIEETLDEDSDTYGLRQDDFDTIPATNQVSTEFIERALTDARGLSESERMSRLGEIDMPEPEVMDAQMEAFQDLMERYPELSDDMAGQQIAELVAFEIAKSELARERVTSSVQDLHVNAPSVTQGATDLDGQKQFFESMLSDSNFKSTPRIIMSDIYVKGQESLPEVEQQNILTGKTAVVVTAKNWTHKILNKHKDLLPQIEGEYTVNHLPQLLDVADVLFGARFAMELRSQYFNQAKRRAADPVEDGEGTMAGDGDADLETAVTLENDLLIRDLVTVANGMTLNKPSLEVELASVRLANPGSYGWGGHYSQATMVDLSDGINQGGMHPVRDISPDPTEMFVASKGDLHQESATVLYRSLSKNSVLVGGGANYKNGIPMLFERKTMDYMDEHQNTMGAPDATYTKEIDQLLLPPWRVLHEYQNTSTANQARHALDIGMNHYAKLFADDPELIDDLRLAEQWLKTITKNGVPFHLPHSAGHADVSINRDEPALSSMFMSVLNQGLESRARDSLFEVQFANNTFYAEESTSFLTHLGLAIRGGIPMFQMPKETLDKFLRANPQEKYALVNDYLSQVPSQKQAKLAMTEMTPASERTYVGLDGLDGSSALVHFVPERRSGETVRLVNRDPKDIRWELTTGAEDAEPIVFGVTSEKDFIEKHGLKENVGFVESVPEDYDQAQDVIMSALQKMRSLNVLEVAVKLDPRLTEHQLLVQHMRLEETAGNDKRKKGERWYRVGAETHMPDLQSIKPELPNYFKYMTSHITMPLHNEVLRRSLLATQALSMPSGLHPNDVSFVQRASGESDSFGDADFLETRLSEEVGTAGGGVTRGGVMNAEMISPYHQNKTALEGRLDQRDRKSKDWGKRNPDDRPAPLSRHAMEYVSSETVQRDTPKKAIRNIGDARLKLRDAWLEGLLQRVFTRTAKNLPTEYKYLDGLGKDFQVSFEQFKDFFDEALAQLQLRKGETTIVPNDPNVIEGHYTGDGINKIRDGLAAIQSGNVSSMAVGPVLEEAFRLTRSLMLNMDLKKKQSLKESRNKPSYAFGRTTNTASIITDLRGKVFMVQEEMDRLYRESPDWVDLRDRGQAVANGMTHEYVEGGTSKWTLSDKEAYEVGLQSTELRSPKDIVQAFMVDTYAFVHEGKPMGGSNWAYIDQIIDEGFSRVSDRQLPDHVRESMPKQSEEYDFNGMQYFAAGPKGKRVYVGQNNQGVIYHIDTTEVKNSTHKELLTHYSLIMATLNGAQGAVVPTVATDHLSDLPFKMLQRLGYLPIGETQTRQDVLLQNLKGAEGGDTSVPVSVMAFSSQTLDDIFLDTATQRPMSFADQRMSMGVRQKSPRFNVVDESQEIYGTGKTTYSMRDLAGVADAQQRLDPRPTGKPSRSDLDKAGRQKANQLSEQRTSQFDLSDQSVAESRDFAHENIRLVSKKDGVGQRVHNAHTADWAYDTFAPTGFEYNNLRHAHNRAGLFPMMIDYSSSYEKLPTVQARYTENLPAQLAKDMHVHRLKLTKEANEKGYYENTPAWLGANKVPGEYAGATRAIQSYNQTQNAQRILRDPINVEEGKEIHAVDRRNYGRHRSRRYDRDLQSYNYNPGKPEYTPYMALRQDDLQGVDAQRIRKAMADPEMRKKFKEPPEKLLSRLGEAKSKQRSRRQAIEKNVRDDMQAEKLMQNFHNRSNALQVDATLPDAPHTSRALRKDAELGRSGAKRLRQDEPDEADQAMLDANARLDELVTKREMVAMALRDQRASLRDVATDLGSYHDVHSRARKGAHAYMPVPKYRRNAHNRGEAAMDVRGVDMSLRMLMNKVKNETFGDGSSLESQFAVIEREYAPLLREAEENGKSSTGHTYQQLMKRKEMTKRDATAMLQRILGTHGHREDASQFASRLSSAARDFNYMRMMGGVALSSIPDIAMAISTAGMRHYFGAWGEFLKGNLTRKDEHKDGMSYLLYAAETVLGEHRANKTHMIDESLDPNATWIEQKIHEATRGFGRLTGIQHWNGAMKSIAACAIQSRMIDVGYKIRNNKATDLEKEMLRQFGVSPNMAVAFAKMHEQVGETGTTFVGGKFYHARLDRWQGAVGAFSENEVRSLHNTWKMATVQAVNRTIVTPGAGDLPLMADGSPMGKMLFQFKSFTMAATQQVLISGMQRGIGYGDMSQLVLLMSLSSMGGLVYVLRELMAGRDPFEREDFMTKLMVEGLDRGGALGLLSEVNQVMEKVAGFGMSSLTESGPLTRYMKRNKLDAILGPSFGLFGDLLEAGGMAPQWLLNDHEISRGQASALRRLMPYQNLLQTRFLLDVAPNLAGQGGYFDGFKPLQERIRTGDFR